jgi:hypothetical protein
LESLVSALFGERIGDYALIDRRRMLLVRDGTIRQSGSPSPTVAAGSGPTVPLVADRRNLHTDAGVPPVSRRQAVAAKAELASFRDSYLPVVKLRN